MSNTGSDFSLRLGAAPRLFRGRGLALGDTPAIPDNTPVRGIINSYYRETVIGNDGPLYCKTMLPLRNPVRHALLPKLRGQWWITSIAPYFPAVSISAYTVGVAYPILYIM